MTLLKNMPKGFPVKKMKEIQQKIQDLPDENQRTILKIIKENNIPFTENSNGIFFDLMSLPSETLDKISKFLIFCDNCNVVLDKRDKELSEIKKTINTRPEEFSNPRSII